jgi:heme/copper-type cytochrome/quinol oxidase subunit 2
MNATVIRRFAFFAALFVLAMLCGQAEVLGCPNCKDALAQHDPTAAGLARGYALSIMFMLSMPFLITAGLSTYFYLLVRQARKQAALAALAEATATIPFAADPERELSSSR